MTSDSLWAIIPSAIAAWGSLVIVGAKIIRRIDKALDLWHDMPDRMSGLEGAVDDLAIAMARHIDDDSRHLPRKAARMSGPAAARRAAQPKGSR